MSTLIIAGDNNGGRRCDARCHDAITPECDCVCGGRYHGKRSGSAELKEAVEQYGREMLEALEAAGHNCSGLREALGIKPPRCDARYKTNSKFILKGERCRADAVMSVKFKDVKGPVLLCANHYRQWCNEELSKVVQWTARDIVPAPAKAIAGGSEGV